MTRKYGPNGQTMYSMKLGRIPEQKIMPYGGFPAYMRYAHETGLSGLPGTLEILEPGKAITPPVPINTPAAHFTDEARRKRITGTCVISLIVDVQGLPQMPQVTRSLDPGMDQQALIAVDQYRFKPAVRDGNEPVPVRITVEVRFHLGTPPS